MVARRLKGVREARKDSLTVMVDRRGLAVHQASRPHDPAAKCGTDALMAEADAKDRDLSGKLTDEVATDAGFLRGLRSRRDYNLIGMKRFDLLQRNLVVPEDARAFAELAQVLDQIIGEGIVVIDDNQHRSLPRTPDQKIARFG